MRNFKNTFLALLLASTSAIAAEDKGLSFKLDGVFDFNTVMRKQDKPAANLSANNDTFVFNSGANVNVKVSNELDGIKYGANIVLLTTAKGKTTPGYNGSYLFIESDDFGKVEFGSPFDAATKMQIDGNENAVAASGACWAGVVDSNPSGAYGFDINIFDFYLSNFNSKNLVTTKRETSRKISYYTPLMAGLKFGISFIPDSTNSGAFDSDEVDSYSSREVKYVDQDNVKKYNIRYGVTNAFAIGASYENQIDEAIAFKISATGEYGKALQQAFLAKPDDAEYQIDPNVAAAPAEGQPKLKSATLEGDYKIKDLLTYNVGATLAYGDFALSTSYGNLNQSFTSKALDGDNRDTYFYGAAAAYAQGPIGVSLTYLAGSSKKNVFNSIALGTEYKFMPGLITYAEVGYAWGSGKGQIINEEKTEMAAPSDQKFSGIAGVLGLKVKF